MRLRYRLIPSGCNVRLFCIAVDNAGLRAVVLRVDEPHEQGDLVVRIQAVPEHIGKCVDIVRDLHELRLAPEARQRIAVTDISVNEVPLTCKRILIGEGEPLAGFRIALCGFQNGQRIVERALFAADDAGDAGVKFGSSGSNLRERRLCSNVN